MQGSFMCLSLFFLKPRSWIHHFNRNWNKCTKDHCKQNIQSFSPLGAESKPPSSSIVHFDVPSLVAICLLMHVLTNFIIVQLINTFNTKFILTNIQNWNINTRHSPLYKQNSSSDYYAQNLISVTFLSKCYLSFTPLLRHHHKNHSTWPVTINISQIKQTNCCHIIIISHLFCHSLHVNCQLTTETSDDLDDGGGTDWPRFWLVNMIDLDADWWPWCLPFGPPSSGSVIGPNLRTSSPVRMN